MITVTRDNGMQGLIQLEIKGERAILSPLDIIGQCFYEDNL